MRPVTSYLRSAVAAVDDQVGAGGVGGCIRGQVKVSALELVGLTLAAHGNLVPPDLLSLLRHETGDLGSDVARGDGVGAGKANPFHRQRLA